MDEFLEQEGMSFSEYLDVLVRRKLSLLLTASAIILLSVIVALFLPPVYRSSAVILVEAQEIPSDFVMTTVTSYVEQRVHTITQRVLSSNQLLELINTIGLFADIRERTTTEELVNKLRERIQIKPISVDIVDPRTGRPREATGTVEFSFEGRQPRQVQRVTDTIVTKFLAANLEERQRQTAETTTFLTEEMGRVKAQLAAAEGDLSAFKEKHLNALPEMMQLNQQTISSIETQRARSKAQLRSFQEREGYLQTQLASIPETQDTHLTRLQQLEIELVNLKTKFTDDYPDVRKMKREIEDLKRQRAQVKNVGAGGNAPDNVAYITLASQLSSTRAEISALKRQIIDLETQADTYRKRIGKTPMVEETYNGLLIERNSTRAKYEDLMRKVMEASVADGLEKDQKGEHFTLIEPAAFPERPAKPNRFAILVIGVVLGLGGGIGVAALREFTDTSLHGPEDLVRAGVQPLLAVIPKIHSERNHRKVGARRWGTALGCALAMVTLIVAFHFLVMDLDLVWIRLLHRFSI